jgi:hypothetical protein
MLPIHRATKINPNSASVAEQILQGMISGDSKPQLSPPNISTKSTKYNIKDVKVPDSLVENILNFATKKEEQPIEEPEQLNEEVIVQNKMEDLVKRLSDLLREAKTFISEMNSTGMLGTNMAKPCGETNKPKKKKRKP